MSKAAGLACCAICKIPYWSLAKSHLTVNAKNISIQIEENANTHEKRVEEMVTCAHILIKAGCWLRKTPMQGHYLQKDSTTTDLSCTNSYEEASNWCFTFLAYCMCSLLVGHYKVNTIISVAQLTTQQILIQWLDVQITNRQFGVLAKFLVIWYHIFKRPEPNHFTKQHLLKTNFWKEHYWKWQCKYGIGYTHGVPFIQST